MDKFVIRGGRKLNGEIRVKGAKNLALKILASSLLTGEEWAVSNVPQIEDVFRQIELLRSVGVEIKNDSKGAYCLRARNIKTSDLDCRIAKRLKGSVLMAGPLLARSGEAKFPASGGCVIGQRPRDIFLDGFRSFGANIKENKNGYYLTAKRLKGTKFVFPQVSVTATEAMILTAVLAEGETFLVNAACEPEISALSVFLNRRGAKIQGVGSPFIRIKGVKSLNKGACRIMPDRIEAGSFAILAAAVNSPVKIVGLNPGHLDILWSLFDKIGVDFDIGSNFVKINHSRKLKSVDLKTHEYPGFPTDLQAPFAVLMTQTKGLSLIHETIFEGRLFYTDILNQMGAKITLCDPHRAIVKGPTKLYGRNIISPDIRAGIALVIAALIAKGETIVENIYQIDRGYEKIEERLQKLGADIKRVNI